MDLSGGGDLAISPFGYPDTRVYGQVITAPYSCNTSENTTLLLSFGFVIGLPTDIQLEGVVYQWDDSITSVVGPALFVSDTFTSPSDSDVLVNVTLPTPIELDPGTQYVIFLHTLPGASGTGHMEVYMASTPYQGGSFVYYNSPPDDYSGAWASVGAGVVASFIINYE